MLLIDGQVGNEKQILEQVLAARGHARFYSFGIGTNVSEALLRDLAKQTDGGVEFIHPGERIDDKMVAIFAKAVAPRVEDAQVRFVGLEAGEVSPQTWPALVDGEPWVVFGRYASPGRGTVEVRGNHAGNALKLDVRSSSPRASTGPSSASCGRPNAFTISRRWRSPAVARGDEGAHREARGRARRVSPPCTSFVVVEHRTGNRLAKGTPEARFVPVNVPAGFGRCSSSSRSATRPRRR